MMKLLKGTDPVFLIVGLGNPGERYAATRHNAGFCIIEALAKKMGTILNSGKYSSEMAQTVLSGEKIILQKPSTFMNLSGEAVAKAASFYKIPPEKIIVAYDDMDLALGRIRLASSGRDAGHNGLKSIIQHLGTQNFMRLKIGIGRPRQVQMEVNDHVLGKFLPDEKAVFAKVVSVAAEALECVVQKGLEKAMNQFNGTAC